MNDPVIPFELQRMFLGDAPPLFLLEIVFRTAVIYAYAMLLIRWIGGRSVAQMSVVEFLLVIALGSAVGDAMFYPDVPLLHAGLVITVVVVINKILDTLIFHYTPVEHAIDGRARQVVRDGVVDYDMLHFLKLGQSELHEALRRDGVENLGQVRDAYVEKSGQVTLFTSDKPRPGLPIVPPLAVASWQKYRPGDAVPGDSILVCLTCGNPLDAQQPTVPEACENCGGKTWIKARDSQPADAA